MTTHFAIPDGRSWRSVATLDCDLLPPPGSTLIHWGRPAGTGVYFKVTRHEFSLTGDHITVTVWLKEIKKGASSAE